MEKDNSRIQITVWTTIKKLFPHLLAFFLLAGVSISGSISCQAVSSQNNDLNGVSQVVLVTVSSTTSTEAEVTAYEATEEGKWVMKKESSGRVGKAGIEPIETRKQNTNKTPQGIMKLLEAYGKKADPGALFSYHEITDDMYWDLNSGSSTYNRLVYKNPGGSYEHLIDYDTYNYMVTTDYNIEQTAKKGGAIFFHCNGKGATAGCVSVPEETMEWYMTWLDPDKNPVIIVTTTKKVQKYFVPATTITRVQADSPDSLEISWERVYGTNRYFIQRADSEDGTYENVQTISDPETTYWIDTDVESGKNYYYRIKTRNYLDGKAGYTGVSNIVSNKIFQVSFESNGGTGSMESIWVPYNYNTQIPANRFKREGYTFVGWTAYRGSIDKWRTKKNGWQTASAISENGYSKYIYKNKVSIKATSSVNKDKVEFYANWAKNPAAPKLKSAKAKSDGQIQIKWSASSTSNIKGYRIYRKTSDSGWEKLDDVIGHDIVSYEDTSVESGVNYYYTVRAYRAVNQVKVWSTYDKKGVSAIVDFE